jgi:benzoylformate decarboxylase
MTSLGRDVVFDYLRDLGIDRLFGVPGTNELPLIDGTNEDRGVSYVPCLHENIAMGAAMGYARASGRPGVLELHITPGAGHGLGNLFNASKSHVPLVVLCAQQHTDLLVQEPVLASDLTQVARQYTKWAYEVRSADELPLVLQRAFKEAMAAPAGPVFLAIPWELMLAPVPDGQRRVTRVATGFTGAPDAVAAAAAVLAQAKDPIIVAGDGVGAAGAGAWDDLQRLAGLLGAPVYAEALSSYMNYPNGRPEWQGELPQTQTGMHKVFAGHDVAFLCGFNAQAQDFVFDHALGPLLPDDVAQVYLHDDEWQIGKNGYGEAAILGDIGATLPPLCDAVAAHDSLDREAAAARATRLRELAAERDATLATVRATESAGGGSSLPSGTDVAATLAQLQHELPAPLMLVNEAVSDSPAWQALVDYPDPRGYFFAQGGSLGYSMPASIGMKLAVGDTRTVVNAIGDGSTLFYPTAWWTAARFSVPVLFLVVNNREYKTLRLGLQALEQIYDWKPAGDDWYLRLGDHAPVIDFVALAAAFGVQGARVATLAELPGAMRTGVQAVAAGQPYVLEILTDPTLPQMPTLDVVTATKENDHGSRLDHIGPA